MHITIAQHSLFANFIMLNSHPPNHRTPPPGSLNRTNHAADTRKTTNYTLAISPSVSLKGMKPIFNPMATYNVPLQQAHNPISISRSANTEAPKETDGKFSWDMARVQMGSEERFMRASASQTDGRSSLGFLGCPLPGSRLGTL